MKEINWKSLSLSLIISTILNGTFVSVLLIRYNYYVDILLQTLKHLNKPDTSITIATYEPFFSFWIWILIFCISYIFVTMISYYLINYIKQRKR